MLTREISEIILLFISFEKDSAYEVPQFIRKILKKRREYRPNVTHYFFVYFVQMLTNAFREGIIVSSLVTTLTVATAVLVAWGTN